MFSRSHYFPASPQTLAPETSEDEAAAAAAAAAQTGIASSTRDLLAQGALAVVGEIYISVKHHLVTACASLDQVNMSLSLLTRLDKTSRPSTTW